MGAPNREPAAWQGHGSGWGWRASGMQQPGRKVAQPAASGKPLRLAPYARHVLEQQRAGRTPNVYLFAGSDAWNQAEYRRRTHGDGSVLVLPPGEHPDRFRWPRLEALVALPGDCPGHRFRALIRALLVAGCRCVFEIRPGMAETAHYADESDALGAACRT